MARRLDPHGSFRCNPPAAECDGRLPAGAPQNFRMMPSCPRSARPERPTVSASRLWKRIWPAAPLETDANPEVTEFATTPQPRLRFFEKPGNGFISVAPGVALPQLKANLAWLFEQDMPAITLRFQQEAARFHVPLRCRSSLARLLFLPLPDVRICPGYRTMKTPDSAIRWPRPMACAGDSTPPFASATRPPNI